MSRVVFIGSKKLGLSVLEKMYSLDPESLIGAITLDDSRDDRSILFKFQIFCESHGLDFYICNTREGFNKVIEDWEPDICIVTCWYWLIEKKILDLVPSGFIGIHYSPLPKYRGGSPAVWQMINGEREIGYSVFYLAEGMDSGDILYTGFVENKLFDSISDILEKLEIRLLGWFDNNYLGMLDSSIESIEQDSLEIEPTYCAQRFPYDGKIDWNKPAIDVYNFIRAQSKPYPGAFTFYKGRKLIIWQARPPEFLYYGTPGQVARIGKTGVWVVCGDNRPIILEKVQYDHEEKKASSVLKSFSIRLGRK